MARNSRSMNFDLFGRDKTLSKTMRATGRTAEGLGKKFHGTGLAIAAGLGIGIIGLTRLTADVKRFGVESVKNAAEAEAAQANLANSFKKFNITTNIKQLQAYNSALEMKVGIDDDELASGQAVLARFKLTGAQIQKLTPLLADYSVKTGKDIPSSAKDLGRALLGQGRALKVLGVDFKDTKTLGGNFAELMDALKSKVGGAAAKSLETYEGKVKLIKVGFGEVKESLGRGLLPSLSKFADFLNTTVIPAAQDLADWAGPRLGRLLGKGLGKLTSLFKALDKKGIRGFVKELAKVSPFFAALQPLLPGIQKALPDISKNFAAIGDALVPVLPQLLDLVIKLLPPLTGLLVSTVPLLPPVIDLLNILAGVVGWAADNWANLLQNVANLAQFMSGDKSLQQFVAGYLAIKGPMKDVTNYILGTLGDGINGVIDLFNGASHGIAAFVNAIRKGLGLSSISFPILAHVALIPISANDGGKKGGHGDPRKMAAGGIAMPRSGGVYANIAEAGVPEAVIPLSRQSLAKHGLGGSGTTVHVTFSGSFVGNENQVAQEIRRVLKKGVQRGAIPAGAV